MRSDIIPPNRAITVVLIIGILALLGYGAYNHDPATVVIIAVLFIFFAMPALLLYSLNRRAGQRPPADDATPTDPLDHLNEG